MYILSPSIRYSIIFDDCILKLHLDLWGRRGIDRMVIRVQLPLQSVPNTTQVVSYNPFHGEVYSIQHYVIKCVSDLRQVGGFLKVLRFPPPIQLIATI